jgi:HAD superfamily hydrolase (TIGR01509 family)
VVKIKHVIFDCDGVLIDSEAVSMATDQKLLASCGVEISIAEMHRRFVGKTFQAMIDEIEAELSVSLPKDLEARKDDLMVAEYRQSLQPVLGVREALDQIFLPKSIGTNGPRARALLALDVTGIAHHFDGRLTTFEEVKEGKPAPDVYLLAAKRAGVKPEQCAVIEDSVTGMMAAAAAGCHAVGFTGSNAHRDEHALALSAVGAKHIIHHMAELPKLVSALS